MNTDKIILADGTAIEPWSDGRLGGGGGTIPSIPIGEHELKRIAASIVLVEPDEGE